MPYLVVDARDDVDRVTEAVVTLGAKVLRAPGEERGVRSAVIADARGAIFGVTARRAETIDHEGAFTWNELLTDDAESSATFYAKLLGCEIESIDLRGGGVYRMLRRGGARVAGVMTHPEKVHPHWLPYVTVRDVGAATRRAVELGGSIYIPPLDVPGFGRFSGIDDPTGAGVCLLTRA